jgi:ribosome-associated translation inhibitor RaiA
MYNETRTKGQLMDIKENFSAYVYEKLHLLIGKQMTDKDNILIYVVFTQEGTHVRK